MKNRTAPILAAVLLGGLALTPVFIKSFGDNPQVATIGNKLTGGTTSAAPITASSTDLAKASYSAGYMMGSNVKQEASEMSLADLQQGINDGFNGKQAPLTREQMEQAIIAYQQQKVGAMQKDNLAKGQAFLAQNAKKAEVKTTASGLQYEVLKEGTGPKPKASDIVAVQYEGKLIDGTVFDSTAKHGGQPAVFPLNQVIPGWTEGVQLMNEGAKYRFYIPSNLAYGEQGAPGAVPPNSVLTFDVELVKVNPPADAGMAGQPSVEDIQAQLQQQLQSQQPQGNASQPTP